MSKLVKKLKELSGAEPPPIGFARVKAEAPKPRLLLVAGVAQADMVDLESCVAGADGGLVYLSGVGTKALGEVAGKVPDIPWGVWLKGGRVKNLEKLSFDFAVFPALTSAEVVKGDKTGKILELESSLGDTLLRAAGELSVDGVLIDDKEARASSLTWYNLMLFQRFAGLVGKPLLVRVSSKLTGSELEAMWEVGVDGIIVEAEAGKPDKIGKLRELLDQLTFPSKRKKTRGQPLLPYLGGGTESVAEEADDEGEEEE